MKLKHLLITALAVFISGNTYAGNPVIDVNNTSDPKMPAAANFLNSADIDIFTMYAFGSDTFEDTYGVGGSLGWKLNNIIGLETEYWYLADPGLHNAALNAVLELPVSFLSVRPFAGVGFSARDAVTPLGQAGVDIIWAPTQSNWDLSLGYRFIYEENKTNYQGLTLSVGLTF